MALSSWVGEVQDWFVQTSETGEVPDERTIRRRLTPIWKALRGSGYAPSDKSR